MKSDKSEEADDPPACTGEEERTICGLSREMLPCKLLFMIMDMGWMCIFPYITIFYLDSGLTIDKIGLSNCVGNVVGFLAFPFWGAAMDSIKRNRMLFITIMIVTLTCVEFSKPLVVMFVSKHDLVNVCNHTTNASSFQHLDQTNHTHCWKKVLLNPQTLWLAVCINSLVSTMCFCGTMAYTECVIIKTVFPRSHKGYTYGEQKVFGPVGSGLGVLLAGIAIDSYKPRYLSKYLAAFYLYVPLSLLMLPLLYVLTKQADWNYGKRKKGEKKVPVVKDILTVVLQLKNIMFVLSVFMSGLLLETVRSYLMVFMHQTMRIDKAHEKTIMSITMVISTASELLVYPFSTKLIRYCGGQIRTVIIGLAASSLRLLGISYCTKIWHVYIFTPLQGFGMSLAWTAMVEQTWKIFPKEITTSGLGVIGSMMWIAPSIISNLLGGQLYHQHGGPWYFRGVAMIGGGWMVLMFIYNECASRREAVESVRMADIVEENDQVDNVKEIGYHHDIDLHGVE